MELVKAKIKGTDDVAVLGKFVNGGQVLYRGTGEKVFTADEVEELGSYEEPYQQPQPTDDMEQFQTELIEKVTEMVNGYVELFDRQYWQRQRVEFAKILLQREHHITPRAKDIVNMADEYVKCLKETSGIDNFSIGC